MNNCIKTQVTAINTLKDIARAHNWGVNLDSNGGLLHLVSDYMMLQYRWLLNLDKRNLQKNINEELKLKYNKPGSVWQLIHPITFTTNSAVDPKTTFHNERLVFNLKLSWLTLDSQVISVAVEQRLNPTIPTPKQIIKISHDIWKKSHQH